MYYLKAFSLTFSISCERNMDVEITESDFNGKETFFDTEKVRRG